MKPKRVLNKWQLVFYVNRNVRYVRDVYTVCFGLFKFISFPGSGEYPTKKNYNGFLREYDIWTLKVKRNI